MRIKVVSLTALAILLLSRLNTADAQGAPPGWQPVSPHPAASRKPWLGVSLDLLTRYYRRYYRVPFQYGGVLVRSVYPRSPAATAGVRAGDVIVRINGRYMYRPADVVRYIRASRAGQSIRVDLYRYGAWKLVTVRLGRAGSHMAPRPMNPWRTRPPLRKPPATGTLPHPPATPAAKGKWVRELVRQINELKREVRELKKKVKRLETQLKSRKSGSRPKSGGSSRGGNVPPPAPPSP